MDYKKYNDYELIDKIQENDDDSKNIMFDKYQPLIRGIANKYYQKYSDYGYQYEDFVQEAMIAFYKALTSYNEQRDNLFYTFVILCIDRNLLTFCKNISNPNRNVSYDSIEDINEANIVDVKSDVHSIISEYEQQEFIKDFIYELPLEVGAIIELKWNGFTYREIGFLLDIPSSSVEWKSRRARGQLQKKFYRTWCK